MTGNGSGFEFPCEVPIKVFGLNQDEFREAVLAIVRTHFPEFHISRLSERASRENRYLSLTITLWAETREQIDALYTELTAHETVLMML